MTEPAHGVEKPDTSPHVWSNVNAGEVLPGVVTPLMWSLISGVLDELTKALFGEPPGADRSAPIFGIIGGRVYFDIVALEAAVRRMPFLGSMDATQLLGGLQTSTEYPAAAAALSSARAVPGMRPGPLRRLQAVPRFVEWAAGHRPGRSADFVSAARDRTRRLTSIPLSRMTDDEITSHALDTVRSMDGLVDSVGFSGVAMALFTTLGGLCRTWLGDKDGRLTRLLVTGLGGIASAQAGFALQDLATHAAAHPSVLGALESSASWSEAVTAVEGLGSPGEEFLDGWDAFMSEHGHHGLGELEVANPRWREQPEFVLRAVISAAGAGNRGTTLTCAVRRQEERATLTWHCLHRLRDPLRRRLFASALRAAQRGSVARENGKNEAIRRIAAIREVLLELGGRLAARGALQTREDVFFLTIPELGPAGRGAMDPGAVSGIVHSRRLERERDLALAPPPVVVGTYYPAEHAAPPTAAPTVFHGLPASPGLAIGPARVVGGFDSGQRLLPGEILVAPYTDPGWTPYFLPASGIVTDMGGLLSHSSIVAREYGIPAVVNTGTATRHIRTGQMLRVDGSLGEVRVL
jgi:phosphohistidine swiveling domain-containing protein